MTMRLINGECLEIMQTMDDNSVDLIATDPPYGIDYQSNHAKINGEHRYRKIEGDETPAVFWLEEAFRILKDGGRLLCFYRWDVQDIFYNEIIRVGFDVKSQIIWDKQIHGMGDLTGAFAPMHENIFYATKGRYTFKGKRPRSIVSVGRVMPEKLTHPAEKPVLLLRTLIKPITSKGDIVLDPFMGSGSTGEACKLEGREFIGIELDDTYFNQVQQRLSQKFLL